MSTVGGHQRAVANGANLRRGGGCLRPRDVCFGKRGSVTDNAETEVVGFIARPGRAIRVGNDTLLAAGIAVGIADRIVAVIGSGNRCGFLGVTIEAGVGKFALMIAGGLLRDGSAVPTMR